MSRDQTLFLVIGALVGFIAGYLLHEQMADVQPQRLVHGGDAAALLAGAPGPEARGFEGRVNAGPPGPPPAGGSGGPQVPFVAQLTRRVAENPDDADAVLQLAQLNFQIQNWIRARDLFAQYLSLRPDGETGGSSRAEVLLDLGASQRASGQLEEAVASFDSVLESEPDNWLALYNKALVVGLDQGRAEDAGEVVTRLRRVRPGDARVERLADEIERRRGAG